eukprot:COSAG06_NODE_23082_length_703_cov_0.937086_2_plen_173_part_01
MPLSLSSAYLSDKWRAGAGSAEFDSGSLGGNSDYESDSLATAMDDEDSSLLDDSDDDYDDGDGRVHGPTDSPFSKLLKARMRQALNSDTSRDRDTQGDKPVLSVSPIPDIVTPAATTAGRTAVAGNMVDVTPVSRAVSSSGLWSPSPGGGGDLVRPSPRSAEVASEAAAAQAG